MAKKKTDSLFKNFKEIALDKIATADWNYKTDDPVLLEKLVNNIKTNGQIENLLVRKLETGFYQCVNGNHRIAALNKLGIKTAVCYDLGDISDYQAKRIAIETNETKFETDQVKLAELIDELNSKYSIEELSQTMPYTGEEIQAFKDMLDFDFSEYDTATDNDIDSGSEKEDNSELFEIECPHCGEKISLIGQEVV